MRKKSVFARATGIHKETLRKTGIFSRQLALNLDKNADTSLFLKKKKKKNKKGYSFNDFLSIRFYIPKSIFINISKLHGNIKSIIGVFLTAKSLQQRF